MLPRSTCPPRCVPTSPFACRLTCNARTNRPLMRLTGNTTSQSRGQRVTWFTQCMTGNSAVCGMWTGRNTDPRTVWAGNVVMELCIDSGSKFRRSAHLDDHVQMNARVPTSHPQVRRIAHARCPFPPPSCWNRLLPVIVGWCALSALMTDLSINWIYRSLISSSEPTSSSHAAQSQNDEIYTWLASE